MGIRHVIAALCATACLAVTPPPLDALTVNEVFQEGVAAYRVGDLETARAKFQVVLDNHPAHPAAKAYLKRIELEADQPVTFAARLAGVSLTGINFREASLDSVLEYMTEKTREATDGEVVMNFVPKLPRQEMTNRKVTLTLNTGVPVTEILRYIGQLADVSFAAEQHAVVVTDTRDQPAPATDGTPE